MNTEQRKCIGIARHLKKADVRVRADRGALVEGVGDAETYEDNSALDAALDRITELEHDWVLMFKASLFRSQGRLDSLARYLVFDLLDDGLEYRIPKDHLTEGNAGMPEHPTETSCGLGTGLPDKGA